MRCQERQIVSLLLPASPSVPDSFTDPSFEMISLKLLRSTEASHCILYSAAFETDAV